MSTFNESAVEFVSHLRGLLHPRNREGRRTLGALRRSAGKNPGTVTDPYFVVNGFLHPDFNEWDENVFYVTGALFALRHQQLGDPGRPQRYSNFGKSYRQLAKTNEDLPRIERRFTALLNSHHEDLHHHLRHAVGRMRVEGVEIDWVRLIKDLRYWSNHDRTVQRAWARGFWGRLEQPDEEQSDA